MRRPTATAISINAAILACAVVAAIFSSADANWDLPTLALLLGFAMVSDLMAASIRAAQMKVSGSFLAIVVAMVLLGGTPAALIGAATILAGWPKWRERAHYLVANLAIFTAFPLVGGVVFDAIRDRYALAPGDTAFPFLVAGTFMLAMLMNFTMVALYARHIDGSPIVATARKALLPLLTSELIAALMAIGVSEVALNWGVGA